ncbi:AraC family ligand binding domain-containing protein [Paenibacillus albidus]|uniref:AraC family ligand binding domain-containing protein n=1 Tax=Paenibacillus albidus TaxID=2041023 RepID=UPI002035B5EA|nr:AraC family ligand binding domain-containing protein [Paenibacillus albidus]
MNFFHSDPFYISRESKSRSSIPSFHYHDAYEILYIVSGELHYCIESQPFQLVGGSMLLIRKNDGHRLINPNGAAFERVTLLFKEEFLGELLTEELSFHPLSAFQSGSGSLRLKGQEQGCVEGIFAKMAAESANGFPESNFYLKILLSELLVFIHRLLNSGYQRISHIAHFINHHYDQRLTLEESTGRFHVSPSHLSRTFKALINHVILAYEVIIVRAHNQVHHDMSYYGDQQIVCNKIYPSENQAGNNNVEQDSIV